MSVLLTVVADRELEGDRRTSQYRVDQAQVRVQRGVVELHMAIDETGRILWTVHDLTTNQQLSSGSLHLPGSLVDLPSRVSS